MNEPTTYSKHRDGGNIIAIGCGHNMLLVGCKGCDRIAACTRACAGIDPSKLATFLEAFGALKADWMGKAKGDLVWDAVRAYDALTGEQGT